MSVDPQDINNKQFKTTRLKEGYDPDEVDAFLDSVAAQVGQLNSQVGSLQEENARLKRRLDNPMSEMPTGRIPVTVTTKEPEPSHQAVKILESAQRVASDLIDDSRTQAAQIEQAAHSKGQSIVAAATSDAYKVREGLDALKAKHEEIRSFLAQHLQTGLAELEGNQP